MDNSRRDFLKKCGFAALGLGAGFPLLRAVASSASADSAAASPAGAVHASGAAASKQFGMIVDIKKCLSEPVRRACIDACHRTHNVPSIPDRQDEVKWLWSEPFENAFPDEVHPYTTQHLKGQPVLVLCNHCTDPGCVKVCPTRATWKRKEDGIVMMDMHRCIGCRYCMAACPYGARSFNWRDPRPYIPGGAAPPYPTRSIGVVEKCTFCEERLRDGLEPACVEAARTVPAGEGALIFGDLSDPDSDVSRVLRDTATLCRKVSAGTGPNVFYII